VAAAEAVTRGSRFEVEESEPVAAAGATGMGGGSPRWRSKEDKIRDGWMMRLHMGLPFGFMVKLSLLMYRTANLVVAAGLQQLPVILGPFRNVWNMQENYSNWLAK
jgi:hypothetical protein